MLNGKRWIFFNADDGGGGGGGGDGGADLSYPFETDPANLSGVDLKGHLLAGKYKTIPDFVKGYGELASKIGQKEEAWKAEISKQYAPPETYDFSKVEGLNEDAAKKIGEQFKAQGFSQKQAEYLAGEYMQIVGTYVHEARANILASVLGGDKPLDAQGYAQTMGELEAFARKEYGDKFEEMEKRGDFDDVAGVIRLHKLMVASKEKGSWNPGNANQGATGKERIAQLQAHPAWADDSHPQHTAIHRELNELYSRIYGDAPVAGGATFEMKS